MSKTTLACHGWPNALRPSTKDAAMLRILFLRRTRDCGFGVADDAATGSSAPCWRWTHRRSNLEQIAPLGSGPNEPHHLLPVRQYRVFGITVSRSNEASAEEYEGLEGTHDAGCVARSACNLNMFRKERARTFRTSEPCRPTAPAAIPLEPGIMDVSLCDKIDKAEHMFCVSGLSSATVPRLSSTAC